MRAGIVSALVVLAVASSVSAASGDALKQPAGHSARYLTVQTLRAGLRGTPLAGHAFEIEQAGFDTHVSPFFMVGASGTESSVFRASCSGNRWNGWGMGSCSASWVPFLPTLRYAFHFYGTYIRSQWPSARTPYDLHGYCGCGDQAWGDKTVAWERQLFGNVPIGISYP